MTILFMFLDGVGLGVDDRLVNPFAGDEMPNLQSILGGRKLVKSTPSFFDETVSFFHLDACLGVKGLPQSATGQAVLLTGKNIPAEIGYHYGPKPDKATAEYLDDGGVFGVITKSGRQAALVNAYPSIYFDAINSGRRMFSSVPLAVTNAGLPLFTSEDLREGRAISADFTADAWRNQLGVQDIPAISYSKAGIYLGEISRKHDFSFFEYWESDYAGHRQDMDEAKVVLSNLDVVIGSLVSAWNENDLLLITSDHGNLEDLSTRRHTSNPVPLILIGDKRLRHHFKGVTNISEITPAILSVLDA